MQAAGMSLASRGELKVAFPRVGGGSKGLCFSSLGVSRGSALKAACGAAALGSSAPHGGKKAAS